VDAEEIKSIVSLRVYVSFLGEKEQFNWWPSSFLSQSGETFITPVFPKTSTLARVNGASLAAQILHDEYIGIGDVFHLFRLPENIEHDISQFLVKDVSILEFIKSKDIAQNELQELSAGEITQGIGPLLLEDDITHQAMTGRMASAYMQGFSAGEQVYPYYRSKV
jgi:hypothetical protein